MSLAVFDVLRFILPQGTDDQQLISRELGDLCQANTQDLGQGKCRRGQNGTREDAEDDSVYEYDPECSFLLPSRP